MKSQIFNMKKGIIIVNVLIFGTIVILVTVALVSWASSVLKMTRSMVLREQAFQNAEAGIDYYRWHLAHAATDYSDGTGSGNGPFIHEIKDAEGTTIGEFSLTITPPPVGSSIVKVKSKGTAFATSTSLTSSRTILATMAVPSLAKYSAVANDYIRFGEGTEVYGPVHSNDGIRFDALAHNLITSAKEKFNDVENPGGYVFGVYTTVGQDDPAPPAPVPNRPDVFMAGRQFPVPVVDFSGFTSDLSQLKANAQSGGKYFANSGDEGYEIVLKVNDTYDIYKVTSLEPEVHNCNNNQSQGGWGTWSVKNKTLIGNFPFPANGIVFVEDHVWVRGQIDGARITIAVGRFPESPGQYRHITINNDLLYTTYDGTDSIGLIAQGNINIGLYSENDLRIDAALIAQHGRVGRYYYENDCGPEYKRDLLTLYGMLATDGRYGFAYTDNTGYTSRIIIYDSNLLYAPPPQFPLTSDQYQTISWQEVNE